MRLAYIRLSKGLPSEAAQREALLNAGLTPAELAAAYVDTKKKPKPGEEALPNRKAIIGAARPDDEIWVVRPAIVAATIDDAIAFLTAISKQGGVLRVASTGESYACPPKEAARVMDGLNLARAIYADERQAALEIARRAIRTKPTGKPPIDAEKIKRAKRYWENPDITADKAAERAGVSVRTLYRYFGKKVQA